MQSHPSLLRSIPLAHPLRARALDASRAAAARRFFFATRETGLASIPTTSSGGSSASRPQLPFLAVPLARNQQFRYLTTARKRWLAHEVMLGFRYTVYIWAIVACLVAGWWSVQQEWLERRYPSPHEWRFITRLRFRLLKWAPDRTDTPQVNWVVVAEYAKNILDRLEDPSIEGAGLEEVAEGGLWIEDIGKSGYDITAKSEPWRRGYYEVLMCCAKAAEQLDDHLVDRTRHLVFPADQVIGPSNPNPKPITPGSPSAPREEDCDRYFEPPEAFYMKILTTKGFTSRQKMDAALAYASWLDFKDIPEAAEKMCEWALQLASENSLTTSLPYDQKTYMLREGVSRPSANVLTSLTALAVHKARNDELSAALPILISILRARRSPVTANSGETQRGRGDGNSSDAADAGASPWNLGNLVGVAKRFIAPPAYPPPPPSGEAPPTRDAKGLCEEAALSVYIGEIMYAARGREDGVAWTREAVDTAEEQLHRIRDGGAKANADTAATTQQTCKECLVAGLDNWSKMVGRLAREEREKKTGAKGSRWLGGLWGEGSQTEESGRWVAEESVVKERVRRAQELLDEIDGPKSGMSSVVWA
ncbi:hypothetical protein BX600DRAFT_465627 [Xylariales sp. PMI_506]|nr:hypothetical protein BX600DRAFT_465627 [Xylariales sp. PMI_506]